MKKTLTITFSLCSARMERKKPLPDADLPDEIRNFETACIGCVYTDDYCRVTRKIIEELTGCGRGKEPDPEQLLQARRPEPGQVKLFDIYLNVDVDGEEIAGYSSDYHRYDGCPVRVSAEGMEIYYNIRGVIRAKRKRQEEV